MSYCPVDFKPCCDDLCRGGGCLRRPGEEMLDRCTVCGELSNGDTVWCKCDRDFDDDDELDWRFDA